jgi:replicative DNA helicase
MELGVRFDREAEIAVLGAVLLDNNTLHEVRPILRPDDFYDPPHGMVYEAMLRLSDRRSPIDIVTLAAELRRTKRFNVLGGAQMLGELTESITESIATTAHVEAHARLVADAARARKFRDLGAWLLSSSADPMVSVEALEKEAMSRLADLARNTPRNALRSQAEVVCSLMERIETLGASGTHRSIVHFGLPSVDTALGGARGGELIIIGGRPAMGKTAFAETWVNNVAKVCRDTDDGVVLFFSEEMPSEELLNRRIAGDARVDSRGASAGAFSGDAFERYMRAANDVSGLPILWHDAQRVSMLDIAMIARRAQHQYGRVALVVVDYLQLLAPMKPDAKDTNRDKDIGLATREGKYLARELMCPVVLLSQLNRQLETRADKRPVMSDLRESGNIEQDADMILFCYRDCVYNKEADPRDAEIIVGKMRAAATATIKLVFDGPRTRFYDPDDPEAAVFDGVGAASATGATRHTPDVSVGISFDDPPEDEEGLVPWGQWNPDGVVIARGGDAE